VLELLRHPRADAAVSLVLALTIFSFAAASSSVLTHGRTSEARWAMLGVLAAVAVLVAAARPRRPLVVPAPALLAGVFVVLAAASTLWSVDPRLTVKKTAANALLVGTAFLLAYACEGRRERVERVLHGVLGGAVLVAVAGLVVLSVDRTDAAPGKVDQFLSRFQGFGERPTTDAMLYALALPVAALVVVRARSVRGRALGIAAFALVDTLLIFSGSRGPQIGGIAGTVVLGLVLSRRGLLVLAAAVAATTVLAVVVVLAQTQGRPPAPQPGSTASAPATASRPAASSPGELAQELGHGSNTDQRTIFGSSGRLGAWSFAIRQGNERPGLGFGFGTEERVFENHTYGYEGNQVSSSWIGLYLQLGLVGVLLLLAIWGSLAATLLGLVRRGRDPVALAAAGVVVAALPLTFVESWIYAVGNVATVPFWISALLLGAFVRERATERVAVVSDAKREPLVV